MKVKRGEYAFRDGDHSKHFYGVIKGRLAVKQRKKEPEVKKLDFLEHETKALKDRISLMSKISSENEILMSGSTDRATFLTSRRRSSANFGNAKGSTAAPKFSLLNFVSDVNNSIASSAIKAGFVNRISLKLKQRISHIDFEECGHLTEGMFFGEWSFLNNTPKRASALALVDSHLFCIDRNNFEKTSLFKFLVKVEIERKQMLANCLISLKSLSKHKLDEFYSNVVTKFYRRNEYVYQEGEPADSIFVIFKGECVFKRDISKPYVFNKNVKPNSNLQVNINQNPLHFEDEIEKNIFVKNKNIHNILKIEKGNISGLEITAGCLTYNHSLVVTSDQAVIFKITKEKLKELKNGIITSLFPLYVKNETYIEKAVNSIRQLQKKMKIHYRNLSDNVNSKNKLPVNTHKEQEREDKIKKIISNIQCDKKVGHNKGINLKNTFVNETVIQEYKNKSTIKKRQSGSASMSNSKLSPFLTFNFKSGNNTIIKSNCKTRTPSLLFGGEKSIDKNNNFFNLESNLSKNDDDNVILTDLEHSPISFIASAKNNPNDNGKFKIKSKLFIKNLKNKSPLKDLPHTERNKKSRQLEEKYNINSAETKTEDFDLKEFKESTLLFNKIKNFSKIVNKEDNSTIYKYDSGSYNLPLVSLTQSIKYKKVKAKIRDKN